MLTTILQWGPTTCTTIAVSEHPSFLNFRGDQCYEAPVQFVHISINIGKCTRNWRKWGWEKLSNGNLSYTPSVNSKNHGYSEYDTSRPYERRECRKANRTRRSRSCLNRQCRAYQTRRRSVWASGRSSGVSPGRTGRLTSHAHSSVREHICYKTKQESLANAKVSTREQCVFEGP